MANVPLSLRIDSEIKSMLEQEAEQQDRSASYIVIQAIKEYFEARENKKMAIEEAIAEAEKGEFVSHESMRTWFASLGSNNELPHPKADIFLK